MRRSLTYKMVGAFVAVSVIAVVLVAISAALVANIEFNRLVSQEATSDFITFVSDYYSTHGSLTGIDSALRDRLAAGAASGDPGHLFPTGLADPQGKVLLTAEGYRQGEQMPANILATGTPIKLNGQVIAITLPRQITPPRNRAQQQFFETVAWALGLATIGGTIVAVLLGLFLARTITRPVHELTDAARRMSQGKLQQNVDVRSRDEVGELGQTFNLMSTELARADQVRRQMTADIAHELRNPLTVVSGYLEAMRSGDLEPTPARLDTAFHEIQHLEQIVDELRNLSLAEAGALTLNRQSIPPSELLYEVAARYENEADQRRIKLSVETDADLPDVNVDPARMMQVFGNLMNNALRYTPKGGSIELSAYTVGKVVRFEVTDSGQGIKTDDLERVFDRFYRADMSRNGKEGQSGLGLAIAKAYVQAHGGTIWAESRPGRGATFLLEIPVSQQPIAEPVR